MSEVNAGIVKITHRSSNLHVVQRTAPGVSVKSSGIQGPKGDPSSASETYQTSRDIGGHRLVVLNANGLLDYASAEELSHAMRLVGITEGAAITGMSVRVLTRGPMTEPTWRWDTQLPVYLGTKGLLTQVPPTAPSKFSMVVGFPMTPDTLYVNPGPAINLAQ